MLASAAANQSGPFLASRPGSILASAEVPTVKSYCRQWPDPRQAHACEAIGWRTNSKAAAKVIFSRFLAKSAMEKAQAFQRLACGHVCNPRMKV